MRTSAQAIARVLVRNNEFSKLLSVLTNSMTDGDLYSQSIRNNVFVDGKNDEWISIEPRNFDKSDLVEINYPYTSDSLTFKLSLSSTNEFLFAFFEVTDDRTVYREINDPDIHRNDHIQISLTDPDNDSHRYTISTHQPAEVTAFSVSNYGHEPRLEPRIHGVWVATSAGYNVELQIPLDMVGRKLSFIVADVDDRDQREVKFLMGSADTSSDASEPGDIIIPSSALVEFLSSFYPLQVTLIDTLERVVAHSVVEHSVVEHSVVEHSVDGDVVNIGAENKSSLLDVLRTHDQKILQVRSPIELSGEQVGTIVIRQSNASILAIRNQAITGLVQISFFITIVSLLAWFALATRITTRLRRLRLALETAVDKQGRVNESLPGTRSRDEIGDLSRSFSAITDRLRQYNQYLETMASRLAHELRTPISVVRSSLENLTLDNLDDGEAVYVERAHEGIERLTGILNKMSEASRLEQSLDEEEIESFDLTGVVRGCVDGYQTAFEKNAFLLSIEAEPVMLTGISELMVQLLDKLVSNAVEFSSEVDPIKIRLTIESDDAVLRIINNGPQLPQGMSGQLLDSMVSVRASQPGNKSHLGLGLYIARIITDFHGGTIRLSNREDTQGVIVTVRIPLMRLSIKLRR